jgi:hypothetical protein
VFSLLNLALVCFAKDFAMAVEMPLTIGSSSRADKSKIDSTVKTLILRNNLPSFLRDVT